MTSLLAGSTPAIGSSNKYTFALLDKTKIICNFSLLPLERVLTFWFNFISNLSKSFTDKFLSKSSKNLSKTLIETLKHDPRPSYQNDSDRIYGMSYADLQIKFKVDGNELEIVDIT